MSGTFDLICMAQNNGRLLTHTHTSLLYCIYAYNGNDTHQCFYLSENLSRVTQCIYSHVLSLTHTHTYMSSTVMSLRIWQ